MENKISKSGLDQIRANAGFREWNNIKLAKGVVIDESKKIKRSSATSDKYKGMIINGDVLRLILADIDKCFSVHPFIVNYVLSDITLMGIEVDDVSSTFKKDKAGRVPDDDCSLYHKYGFEIRRGGQLSYDDKPLCREHIEQLFSVDNLDLIYDVVRQSYLAGKSTMDLMLIEESNLSEQLSRGTHLLNPAMEDNIRQEFLWTVERYLGDYSRDDISKDDAKKITEDVLIHLFETISTLCSEVKYYN